MFELLLYLNNRRLTHYNITNMYIVFVSCRDVTLNLNGKAFLLGFELVGKFLTKNAFFFGTEIYCSPLHLSKRFVETFEFC